MPRKKRKYTISEEERKRRSEATRDRNKKRAAVKVKTEGATRTWKIRPQDYQVGFVEAADKSTTFVMFFGGRQIGKGHIASRVLVRKILSGEWKEGLSWIVAPDYPMAQNAMGQFRQACMEAHPKLIIQEFKGNNPRFLLRNVKGGSPYVVEIKSAHNPDSLRGFRLDYAWLDEAAMYPREAWDLIQPCIATTGGQFFITTTPRGPKNWVYEDIYVPWEQGKRSYAVFHATSSQNAYFNSDILKDLKSKYTHEKIEQELEGKFVSFQGLVYKDFSYERDTVDLKDIPIGEADRWVAGVDWGYDDPFVCLWLALISGTWYLVDEHYMSGEIVENHCKIIAANPLTEHVDRIWCDGKRPENRKELGMRLRKAALEASHKPSDRMAGVEHLAAIFKNQKLKIAKHCVHTLDEIQSYTWKDRGERDSHDKPVTDNDHTMDALRYAMYHERFNGPAYSFASTDKGFVVSGGGKSETLARLDLLKKEDQKIMKARAINPFKNRLNWLNG